MYSGDYSKWRRAWDPSLAVSPPRGRHGIRELKKPAHVTALMDWIRQHQDLVDEGSGPQGDDDTVIADEYSLNENPEARGAYEGCDSPF